jgi:hypothetical protein
VSTFADAVRRVANAGAAAWITLRRTVAGWQRAAEPLVYQPPPRRALATDSAHAIPLAA